MEDLRSFDIFEVQLDSARISIVGKWAVGKQGAGGEKIKPKNFLQGTRMISV